MEARPGDYVRQLLDTLDKNPVGAGDPDASFVDGITLSIQAYLNHLAWAQQVGAEPHAQQYETVPPFNPEDLGVGEDHPYMVALTSLAERVAACPSLRRDFDSTNFVHNNEVAWLRSKRFGETDPRTELSVMIPGDSLLFQIKGLTLVGDRRIQSIEELAELSAENLGGVSTDSTKDDALAALIQVAKEYQAIDQG